MSDPDLMRVTHELLRVADHTQGLVLALLEHLAAKNQNLGAVRRLEAFLTKEEAERVFARGREVAGRLGQERAEAARKAASGLVLPPGART